MTWEHTAPRPPVVDKVEPKTPVQEPANPGHVEDIQSTWIMWPLDDVLVDRLRWSGREVEITWSPQGRSVRVCVDGVQWGPL